VGQGPPYESREVGQPEGLTESSCLFASSDEATRQHWGEGGTHGGPGPTLWQPWGRAARRVVL